MGKISLSPTNDYCPQTLFLYGTYKEDGTPNFGLFCWFSYCRFEELGVMACIGGSKLTLDRIRATKVFSANLVTEKILPLADYFGTVSGRDANKMNVDYQWEKGAVLDVPILSESPVSLELEVDRMIELNDADSVVLLCRIRNVLMDELLQDPGISADEKLRRIAPVSTTCMTYFDRQGNSMGKWCELEKQITRK